MRVDAEVAAESICSHRTHTMDVNTGKSENSNRQQDPTVRKQVQNATPTDWLVSRFTVTDEQAAVCESRLSRTIILCITASNMSSALHEHSQTAELLGAIIRQTESTLCETSCSS
jgi:hypothetical protein